VGKGLPLLLRLAVMPRSVFQGSRETNMRRVRAQGQIESLMDSCATSAFPLATVSRPCRLRIAHTSTIKGRSHDEVVIVGW
jgi:hypothetical protein